MDNRHSFGTHAADNEASCISMLLSLDTPPLHVHDDINGRLSQAALRGLDEVEEWAKIKLNTLTESSAGKQSIDELGDQILRKFLAVLSEPNAFLAHGKCYCLMTL